MLDIKCIKTSIKNGKIVPEVPYKEIAAELIDRKNLVILKKVFDKDILMRLREFVFQWGMKTSPSNPKDALATNWHRIDNNPPQSETKHIMHIYNFVDDSNEAGKELWKITEVMKTVQEELSGMELQAKAKAQGNYMVRPQIIHYPSGGGFFDWHVHSFLPQKVGLILSLADRGVDFETGGTRFKIADKEAGIEEDHMIGDIAIFRYDIVHSISPLDPQEPGGVNFNSTKGKWSLVLPLVAKS